MSPTCVRIKLTPIFSRYSSKARLDITVATTVFLFSEFLFTQASAKSPITMSPLANFPCSSMNKTLSASPSKHIPISALFSRTAFCAFSGFVEPHSLLILKPSGATPRDTTSAPSSLRIWGRILYAAPLAQSATILIPPRLKLLGIVIFANSV